MSSARVDPTRIKSTFSAIRVSRKARQAFFETVGFSSAKLNTLTPCSRWRRASSLGNAQK
jgi:hypothetical protein